MGITISSAQPRLDLLGPILQDGFDKLSFVADQVLPTFLVNKKQGAIPTWLFTDNQILSIKHGRGMPFARVQSQIDTRTFTCIESGVEEPLTKDDFDIVSRDNAEMQLARRLTNIVLRQRELALAQILTGSTNGYSGTTTFSGQTTPAVATWGGGGDAPYTDIANAKQAILKRIGKPANAIVMSYGAYTKLMTSAQIQSQVRNVMGYSGADVDMAVKLELDPNALANVFGVDRVIISRATYNSANEGQAQTFTNIWTDTNCLVFRGFAQDDVLNMDVGLGRMFVYDQANELNMLATGQVDTLKGLIFEMYPDPRVDSDVFRAREYISQTITSLPCGQLITGC